MQQTGAILRALGVQHGYCNPRDYQLAGKIDWIVDTWGELLTANANIVLSMASTAKKNEQFTELVQTKWRPFLVHLEKQLERNNTRFIASNQVTIGDCVMFSVTHNTFLNRLFDGHAVFAAEFQNYPRLNTYAQTIETEFASFINSRTQLAM